MSLQTSATFPSLYMHNNFSDATALYFDKFSFYHFVFFHNLLPSGNAFNEHSSCISVHQYSTGLVDPTLVVNLKQKQSKDNQPSGVC